MARNADETLREAIGGFVIQLVQAQAAIGQLQEQVASLQAQIDGSKGPTLAVDNTKD